MVGELLAGDDAPAGDVALRLAPVPACPPPARRRVGRRGRGSSAVTVGPGEVAVVDRVEVGASPAEVDGGCPASSRASTTAGRTSWSAASTASSPSRSTPFTPGTRSRTATRSGVMPPATPTSTAHRSSSAAASSSIVPRATSRPLTKMPIRSHTCSTWCSRCDDSRTVTERWSLSRRDEGQDLAHALGVDVHRRLVEDEDRRVLHQRVGQAEALAHAARVAPDLAVGHVGQPDLVEVAGDALLGQLGGQPVEARPCSAGSAGPSCRRRSRRRRAGSRCVA